MAHVLIPLPERDFDPTEVAVSWQVLSDLGHTVSFSTPHGAPAQGDELMVSGRGLDPWGFIPGLSRLVGVGRVLRANGAARTAYGELVGATEFLQPRRWSEINLNDFDGLLLPGGHRARGMRQYLESPILQEVTVSAFARDMPVAAVCHGVLLAARSIDPNTGRSVLYGRRTTALTWSLEHRAWTVARITRFWDRNYYRTYTEGSGQPPGYMSVQREVTRALAAPDDFLDVTSEMPFAALKSSGRARDTMEDERPAFVVEDGRYISARWPGDIHTFARRFSSML